MRKRVQKHAQAVFSYEEMVYVTLTTIGFQLFLAVLSDSPATTGGFVDRTAASGTLLKI
jgi:hypothetical protein